MAELYEVVGSILRDITQARCLSDLYSRDVSKYYADDHVLRYFPVPRAEISEASFTVPFVIKDVTVDPTRRNLRNARLSQVFERYASDIVRSALKAARDIAERIKSRPTLSDAQRAALEAFESGFLSEEYRNILRARFVRYFEDHREDIISKENFLRDQAQEDIKTFIEGLGSDPLMKRALDQFPDDVTPSLDELLATIREKLNAVAGDPDLKDAVASAKDFKIDVDIGPGPVQAAGQSVCTISVKATLRNYTWSKIDDDPKEFYPLRTLQPE